MLPKIYIDGQAGTTALRIREWLAGRDDLEVTILPEELRKDAEARKKALRDATIVVLCLPDDAARDAAQWLADTPVRILDASTAHRVSESWIYGLPELVAGQRQKIATAPRVANPGCYSSAVIMLVRPLIDAGLLPPDTPLAIHALSGYSGGGRSMIERWENPQGGLRALPPFRCGMRVEVMIPSSASAKPVSAQALWDTLAARYDKERFVEIEPLTDASEANEFSFDPQAWNDSNKISLKVLLHESGHILLMARLDNLGKGAAGVAIQNLNLMLGVPEQTGLPV